MPETHTYGLFVVNLVLLPGERVPLHIFEPRYRQLFADCVLDDAPFVVLYSEDEATAAVGCTARFEELLERHDDGRISVVVRGLAPAEIVNQANGHLYFSAECRPCPDEPVSVDPARSAQATARFVALAQEVTGRGEAPDAAEVEVPWSYVLAARVELPARIKQALLETRDENSRLDLVIRALDRELAAAERTRIAAERAPSNGKVPHD